ncbi:MAG: GNAT family N-acetyltransferase [Actinomycetota bacterium]
MAIEIRPARPEEFDEAGRVTARSYREFAKPDEPGWQTYLDRLADVQSRADKTLVLVAIEEGAILGTATLELEGRVPGSSLEETPLQPGQAHLRMLGVDPDARRRGIGRRLVEACIEEAERQGKTLLTLNTTRRMRAAQDMYESLGFRRSTDLDLGGEFVLLSYELALTNRA